MVTTDVFRNISERILVFQSQNWDDVPDKPGVYAWYYPIWLNSENLDDLLEELRTVRNYDAKCGGIPSGIMSLELSWNRFEAETVIRDRTEKLPESVYQQWKRTLANKKGELNELKKTLMVSSLLLPPLYIGKTKSLRNRCAQHRNASANENSKTGGTFKGRFEAYAESRNAITSKKVSDLIMACVLTDDTREVLGNDKNEHSLVEEILKIAAQPAYGRK